MVLWAVLSPSTSWMKRRSELWSEMLWTKTQTRRKLCSLPSPPPPPPPPPCRPSSCYNWNSCQADAVSISFGRHSLLLTFLMERVVIAFTLLGGGGEASLHVKRTFCECKLWTSGNFSWCYWNHWLLMERILSGQYIYYIMMLISDTDRPFQ